MLIAAMVTVEYRHVEQRFGLVAGVAASFVYCLSVS